MKANATKKITILLILKVNQRLFLAKKVAEMAELVEFVEQNAK